MNTNLRQIVTAVLAFLALLGAARAALTTRAADRVDEAFGVVEAQGGDGDTGAFGHLLHDRVAVLVPVGEGDEDVEHGGRQRQQALRVSIEVRHNAIRYIRTC